MRYFYGVHFEQFEYRTGGGSEQVLAWDGDAIFGDDHWKLRVQSEGEYDLIDNSFETLEHQFLVQRLISAFFDVKTGIRIDTPEGHDRIYGVVGIHGLGWLWSELDADLFVSDRGDFSGRIDVDYELLITQYLKLTPTVEMDFAFSDDPAVNIGSGFNGVELGLRISYDLIDRMISPYAGVHYERFFGQTRKLKGQEGIATDQVYFDVGMHLRF